MSEKKTTDTTPEINAVNTESVEKGNKKEKKPKLTKEEKKLKKEEKKKEKIGKTKPKNAKATATRLLGYLKPYKGRLALVAFMVVFSTVIAAVAAILFEPIYNSIDGAVTGKIARDVAVGTIGKYLLILCGIYAVSGVMTWGYQKIMLNTTQRLLNQIRYDLFDKLENLPLNYFDTHKTGDIMSRFNADVEAVNSLISNGFISLISACLTLIIDLTLMIFYSWRITLTLTVTIGVIILVVIVITSITSKLYKKQHKIAGDFNGYVEEYIRGQKVVKVFNHEKKAKEGYEKINREYRDNIVKSNVIGGLMSPLLALITRANYAVSVGLGAYMIMKGIGGLNVGRLIVYTDKAKSFGSPIASIASRYNSLMAALAGAERVFEVMDTTPELDEGKITLVNVSRNAMGELEETTEATHLWAWKRPLEDGTYDLVEVKGDIEFKNVSFYYKEGEPVLKNLSIRANAGEKLAFVGSTGAGKTTITNLINRFYDVQEGEITYDGINVKDIRKDDLRRSLSMVLQETRLFWGTIEYNIKYGNLDATRDDVIKAAKIANAHDFIEQLPDGYDTQLRTDGQNISAGQRQLISIARAAIADTPVLILDEATSSVDTRTERLIELGMDGIKEGRTVFMIAHRLSTVRNSDDIIVLEHGEIVEEGSHADLLSLQGKYYQLYTGQFKLS